MQEQRSQGREAKDVRGLGKCGKTGRAGDERRGACSIWAEHSYRFVGVRRFIGMSVSLGCSDSYLRLVEVMQDELVGALLAKHGPRPLSLRGLC